MFFQKIKEIDLGTLGFILFMLPFIAMGVFFLWYGVINTISSFRSNTWPNVQGVITQSSVTYGGDVYRADICYEFSVDSVLYSGSKISMQDYHSSERALADEIAARFPEGMAVAVYYKSENPDNCILEPGFQISSVAIIMVGLLFILLPLRLIVVNPTEPPPPPDDVARFKSSFEHVGVVKYYFLRLILGKFALFALIPMTFWFTNYLQSKGFFTSNSGSLFLSSVALICIAAEIIALFRWDFVNKRYCPSCGLRMKKKYIDEHMVLMCQDCNKYYDLEVSVE